MQGLGFPEIMVILIVALLVFGPKKLPELGKSLGAGLREFRRSTQGLKEEFESVMQAPAPAPPAGTGAQPAQALAPQPAPVTVIAAQPQVQVEPAVPLSAQAVAVGPAAPAEAAPAGGVKQPE